MRTCITVFCLSLSVPAGAGVTVYQTLPGTNVRDYSSPGLHVDDYGNIYQTLPGTNVRDYSSPGLHVDDYGNIYQTLPGTNIRDYDAPGWRIFK